MGLACLVLLAANSGPVSMQQGVMRADLLVADIARQTGEKLSASPSLKKDFLFIYTTPKSLVDAKTILATLTESAWRKRGEKLVLEPLAEEKSLDDVMFDRTIDAWVALARTTRPFAEKSAAEQSKADPAREKVPADMFALRRLPLLLPEQELRSMAPGERIVYSTTPTLLQRPFPPQRTQELRDLVREIVDFRLDLLERGLAGGEGAVVAFRRQDVGERVEVVLARTDSMLTVEFRIADRDETKWLFSSVDERLDQSGAETEAPPQPFAKDQEIVPPPAFDATARNLLDIVNLRLQGKSRPTLTPQARERLLNANRTEPIAVLAEPFLTALAKRRKGGLATIVADWLPGSVGFPGRQATRLTYAQLGSNLERSLALGGAPKTISVDGCLIWYPERTSLLRSSQFSREALVRYLRSRSSDISVFDSLASLSLEAGTDLAWMITLHIAGSALGEATSLWAAMPRDVLNLYGKLDSAARRQVWSGGVSLNMGALPPPVLAIAEKLALSRSPSFSKAAPALGRKVGGFEDSNDDWITQPSFFTGGPTGEITWAAAQPQAVPAIITIKGEVVPRLLGRSVRWRSGVVEPVTIEALAAEIALRRTPKGLPQAQFDQYFAGETRRLTVTFKWGSLGWTRKGFALNQPLGAPMTLADLPEEFRLAAEKRSKDIPLFLDPDQTPPP